MFPAKSTSLLGIPFTKSFFFGTFSSVSLPIFISPLVSTTSKSFPLTLAISSSYFMHSASSFALKLLPKAKNAIASSKFVLPEAFGAFITLIPLLNEISFLSKFLKFAMFMLFTMTNRIISE